MFDVFDILVPELVTSCIEVRQHETAFGGACQKLCVGGPVG
jgi:hypothetical protein